MTSREELERDLSAPPAFLGLENLELYREHVERWCRRTSFPASDRAGRILESLPLDLQKTLRPISSKVDCDEGVGIYLQYLSTLKGEVPGDRSRRAINRALFAVHREKGESLTKYAMRREMQFNDADLAGVTLPDSVKMRFLEEGAGLDTASLRNLNSIIGLQPKSYALVKEALLKLDIVDEGVLPSAHSKSYAASSTPSFRSFAAILNHRGDEGGSATATATRTVRSRTSSSSFRRRTPRSFWQKWKHSS